MPHYLGNSGSGGSFAGFPAPIPAADLPDPATASGELQVTTDFGLAYCDGLTWRSAQEGILLRAGDGVLPADALAWYDFSDSSKLTLSGTEITAIEDNVSGGLSTTITANGPDLSGDINGRQVAYFDGNVLLGPAPIATLGNGFTLFTVFYKSGASNTYESPSTMTNGNANDPMDRWNNRIIENGSGTTTTLDIRAMTTPTILVQRATTTLIQEWVNNVEVASKARTNTFRLNAPGISIGGRHDASVVLLRGYIGEVILCNALTDQELQDVYNFLAVKWSIT